MSDPILLLDASAFLYRSFYALPPLTTSKGQPTHVIKGVLSMMQNLLKSYPNSPIAVVFDAKGKSFRNELYADYKANRPPMPEDLKSQIPPLFDCIKALGLNLIAIDGIEADDTIGTLAREFSAQGLDNLIVSSDKDMAQLVSTHSKILDPIKNKIIDIDAVRETYELTPEQIIDWLALMGDKADNIPGVPGVGNKTAIALLQNMHSIDEIYTNLDQIENLTIRGAKSLKQKLIDNKELLLLSKTLATIKTDCELNISKEDLIKQPTNIVELNHILQDLEFNLTSFKFILNHQHGNSDQGQTNGDLFSATSADSDNNQLQEPKPIAEDIARTYKTILTKEDFAELLNNLNAKRVFAIDTETDSLDYMNANLVGISFSYKAGEAFYLPVGHDYADAPSQLDKTWVLQELKPILEDEKKGKVGQNLKYDYQIFYNHGINLRGIVGDSLFSAHLLNSLGNHDLTTLAEKYLGLNASSFTDIAGKGKNQLTFNQIDIEMATEYAAEDADLAWRLMETLDSKLTNYPRLEHILRNVELPLLKVIADIELRGVQIDKNFLEKLSAEFAERVAQLEKQTFDLAGEEFNLNSTQQLAEILFTKLKLPILKKTPKGAPSTAEEVLQELALDYPLPKLLLEHRSLQKLKNTYTDKLPLLINDKTQRLHTSYHQVGTATGRLSSSDPNLQNIPMKSEEGRSIRKAFIAKPGYKILAADYSQIELRIMAHLSGDEGLLKAFRENKDIHTATAAEVFGIAIEEVQSEQRRKAKAINFGLIYGMGVFGLAKQIQVERQEASMYIEKYFTRYAGVKQFMDKIRHQASEQGYVETILGRRLYLPNINASNQRLKRAAERTAINAPMQGSAADLIKIAMVKMQAAIEQSDLDIKMLMQVHDELVFEVAENHVAEAKILIKNTMEQAMELDMPLVVEVGIGNNWQEAH